MVEQYDITLSQGFRGAKKRRQKERASDTAAWYYLGLVGQIGFSIALPIAAGAFLGSEIDKTFGWYPKSTVSGIGLGFVVSVFGLIHVVQLVMKDAKK